MTKQQKTELTNKRILACAYLLTGTLPNVDTTITELVALVDGNLVRYGYLKQASN